MNMMKKSSFEIASEQKLEGIKSAYLKEKVVCISSYRSYSRTKPPEFVACISLPTPNSYKICKLTVDPETGEVKVSQGSKFTASSKVIGLQMITHKAFVTLQQIGPGEQKHIFSRNSSYKYFMIQHRHPSNPVAVHVDRIMLYIVKCFSTINAHMLYVVAPSTRKVLARFEFGKITGIHSQTRMQVSADCRSFAMYLDNQGLFVLGNLLTKTLKLLYLTDIGFSLAYKVLSFTGSLDYVLLTKHPDMRLYLYKSGSEVGKQDVQFKQQTGTREIAHPFLRELVGNSCEDFTASVHQHYAESELVSSIVVKYKSNFSWKLVEPTSSNWQNFEKSIPMPKTNPNDSHISDNRDDWTGILSLDLLDKRKELRDEKPSMALTTPTASQRSAKSAFTPKAHGTASPFLVGSVLGGSLQPLGFAEYQGSQPKPGVLGEVRPGYFGSGSRGIDTKYNSGVGKMQDISRKVENNYKELLNLPVYLSYLFGFDKKPFLVVGTDQQVDILAPVA